MGVRSGIEVQNVHKILFGEDKGWSHKTCWSRNRGSFVAGTTVYIRLWNWHILGPYALVVPFGGHIISAFILFV